MELSSGNQAHRLAALGLGAFGLLLLWLVITHSLPAALAPTNPSLALQLQGSQPLALLALSDQALLAELGRAQASAEKETAGPAEARLSGWATFAQRAFGVSNSSASAPEQPQDIKIDAKIAAQVKAWARLALLSDPLNAHAIAVLGQVAQTEEEVSGLMQAALRRSIRESLAAYWLLRKYTKDKNYTDSVREADLLLRTRSGMMPLVLPSLALAAEDPVAKQELTTVLAGNPPWRTQFLVEVVKKLPDPRTVLELLLALEKSASPPTNWELRSYIFQLVDKQRYDLAYYTWLQFLPPEELRSVQLLYNGSFESAPSGMPFDWYANAGSGVTVDLQRRIEGASKHALYLEFGEGRVEFNGVAKVLLLPAGDYALKGHYRGNLQGRRGLVWNVTCLDNGLSLLSTPMVLGSIPQWSTFDTPFSVPSGSCPAQRLQLNLDARSPSEQLVTGSMYYDDLQIVRASPTAATAAESGTVTTSEPAAPDTAQSRSSEPAPGTAPPFAVDVPAPDAGIPPTTGAPAQ